MVNKIVYIKYIRLRTNWSGGFLSQAGLTGQSDSIIRRIHSATEIPMTWYTNQPRAKFDAQNLRGECVRMEDAG